MLAKKLFLLAGIILLLVPMTSFVNSSAANADGPFAYPGPFGPYDEDIVTVACAQIEAVHGDTTTTLEKMKSSVIQAAEKGADIIVFAELILNICDRFSNPGCSNLDMAEPFPGPSSLEMEKLASDLDVYIVYGFYEKDNSDPSIVYNSAAIIGPNGAIDVYRKIHPTPLENVKRGYQPVAFQTPWGPVGVSICWDSYIGGELARTYALMGCRLMLNPTLLYDAGGQREQAPVELACRSCENQLFIATTNHVGPSPFGPIYHGESTIIGPKGFTITPFTYAGPASDSDDELIIATLDLTHTDRIRDVGCTFAEASKQSEPLFLPQLWSDLWGKTNGELETANQELETLRLENKELSQTASVDKLMITMLSIAAGVLLLAAIAFGILAFRKKKS